MNGKPLRVILVLAMSSFGIIAGCCVLAAPGFADEKRDGVVTVTMDDSPESEWKVQDISGFAAAVRASDSVVVLEGLPYPEAEKAWYEHESKRKDLIWIRDYPFYPRPLKVSDEDLREVKEILLDPRAHLEFPRFMPSLLTEDFHPNYAVVWSKGGKQAGSVIDLGCRHEWRNFTPAQVLYGRIASQAYEKLSKILGKYQQERPERQGAASPAALPPSASESAEARPIRVAGMLSIEIFPGRPNYESIKDGDEAEEAWILTTSNGEKKQRFQLVVIDDAEQKFATLRRCVGKKVTVEGIEWEAQTGHHHTARLITVSIVREMASTPQPPTAATGTSVSPLSDVAGH